MMDLHLITQFYSVCKVCQRTHSCLHRFQDIYILLCGYEVFCFVIPTKHSSNGLLLLHCIELTIAKSRL